ALRQEEECEAGGDDGAGVALGVIGPGARLLVLFAEQEHAAFAVPVVVAEETLPGESAGAFDAVEVVVGRAVVLEGEVLRDPRFSAGPGGILLVIAAVFRGAVVEKHLAAFVQLGRDDG